jgi:methylated-DNA-protein-cysteine methyltransferase-like protein
MQSIDGSTKHLRDRGSERISANRRKLKARLGDHIFEMPFHDIHATAASARDQAFAETIRSIPRGKVATYGQVAAAAGYPRYHRVVARLLKKMIEGEYPWQRVIGAGGEIKVAGRAAVEQRLRLKLEGVTFIGKRVNLSLHQYVFEPE